jgi:peptide/nickel transport system substrate-binding protein
VIDADTIQIVANDVLADFLTTVGFSTFIIQKATWENVPRSEWVTDPGSTGQDPSRVVGTGPFKFESWTQGQEIKLVRNDLYTPFAPYLKEITVRIFADHEAEFNAFLTGELDDVGLEPAQVETVQQQPDQFRFFEYPDKTFTYYEFNLNPETTVRFQDYRVRQAFMFALDRQSIIDNIQLGHGVVANGPQPVISYAYAPDQMNTVFNYDPERSKQLLAEAGWTDTNGDGTVDKDGVEMAFEFLYPSGDATTDTLVAYLQDAWKAVGIGITPRALEFSALIEATTTTPTFEMALYGFQWDSTFFQDIMFACGMYQIGFNDMKYCNPELDELGQKIKRTIDINERIPLMIQYSNIVNDEQPIGVLHFLTTLGAENVRLKNAFRGPWGGAGIEYIWVADE